MAPTPLPQPSSSSSSPGSSPLSSSILRLSSSVGAFTKRSLRTLDGQILALARRQNIVAIPVTYSSTDGGPSPGTVAGIVLGSVAAVLLVLWLIYTCFNLGGAPARSSVVEDVEVVRSRRDRSRTRSVSRSRASRSEVVEVRSPPRRERSNRRERIVIEETRRAVPPPQEDDIVEVIEEDDTPPQSRRTSERRRVSSGYRTVDPDQFAGGSRPVRKVRR